MPRRSHEPDQPTETYSNINLKVTEDEKWAFKAWCAQNRMTQVEAFRQAFELLKKEKNL